MEEITVSERKENRSFITYLYGALSDDLQREGGRGELLFDDDRTALRVTGGGDRLCGLIRDKIAEVIGVGYKYKFLRNKLHVCLGTEERKILLSALIAADLEGDKAYIRGKIDGAADCAVDGVYNFRLSPLREKWQRIADYVPVGFSSPDLKNFCDFLVEESQNKIYVMGKSVFGENFTPLRRSRLMGEEDVLSEIMLSDAGFVYILGNVEDSVGDFLQKYYAERAIFS